jgi:hypothetical protein
MASMEKINEATLAFLEQLESMELDEEQKESFRIEDDRTADWALERIKEVTEDADRLRKVINQKRKELDDQLEQIDSRLDSQTKYLKGLLEGYFRSGVKAKETKTQRSYKLPTGTLVMRKSSYGYLRDENAIIQCLHGMGKEEYVETTEKLKWADLKKALVFDEDTVYDPETGALIDGITAVKEPEKFEVRLG